MELVWLVYGISLLPKLQGLAFIMAFIGGIVCIAYWIPIPAEEFNPPKSISWLISLIPVLSMLVLILLPSEKTSYMMIGAYATQKVAEQPEAQAAAKDVLTIINSRVKQYALESIEDLEKAQKK